MAKNRAKEFIGNCVKNPFNYINILAEIVDKAKEITKKTFLKYCIITDKQKSKMKEYPNDYTFWKNRNIYFYRHSGIEYFYE
ncbi:unnamed protein product [marine sediment metagenome]|uniref:Uncharacterized protein n=1 Tax=marine sediment metagenome TaxID=412755 RepID=X1D0E7_9ZZZZ